MTTALAFELFRRARVDFVVLEVGLGGRFDATTAAIPVAAAITTIDLDHERFLGHTIAAIAAEKAGVIKPGMPVVVGETKPDAVTVIARVCAGQRATMIPAAAGVRSEIVAVDEGAAVVRLCTPLRDYGTLRLALRGRHQAQNAVVAVRLLEELDRLGFMVPPAAIAAAVTSTRWPGRLDLLSDGPDRRVLCDAAHNPAGARVPRGVPARDLPVGASARLRHHEGQGRRRHPRSAASVGHPSGGHGGTPTGRRRPIDWRRKRGGRGGAVRSTSSRSRVWRSIAHGSSRQRFARPVRSSWWARCWRGCARTRDILAGIPSIDAIPRT